MRLLNGTPLKCSCCYGQYPDREHVDFVSAYEGPLLDPANPRGGHIDWLVLCDECIRLAHNLLSKDERGEQIAQLAAENTRLRAEARKHQAFAEKLQEALAVRPEPIEVEDFAPPTVTPIPRPPVPSQPEPGESEQLEGPASVLPTKPEGGRPARKNRYAVKA